MLRKHFIMMAAYNRWANGILYDAASVLTDEEYRRDTGAFFASMHGTLNHVLVADMIWMHRFTGQGELPGRLDTILHDSFEELRTAREAMDQRIQSWVDRLNDDVLGGRFTYVTATDMKTVSQRLAPALAHFFNHQTHHRGQAHATLTALGKPSLALDLIYFQRAEEGRPFA